MSDPRGPERKIAEVVETRTPCEEGVLYHVSLRLDCGHVAEPASHFHYRQGERYRCFACRNAQ